MGDILMISKTTRRLAPAIVLAACAATAAPSAHAVPEFPIRLDPGLGCSFALLVDGTGGNIHSKEFKDRNGKLVRIIEAGKGVLLTYTNLATMASVTIKTAGSVSNTVVNPDGTLTVTATGHNGLIMFPTDVPAGPTTTQYIGRFVYKVDPVTGVFTFVGSTGQKRDICAELS